MRTALSVLLMYWPPWPDARYTSMRRSQGSMRTSTSSASGSTATVAVEVWRLPLLSVTGMRCTRCTPLSYLSRENAPAPLMVKIASFTPPSSVMFASIISTRQPWRSA